MATSTKTNESIDAYYEGQRKPVEAEIENATAAYEAALAKLQQQKEAADADAYRSYVRQQHEMPGILRAQGNHGGMVDSAVASLLNKYNQGRADRGLQLGANTADQTLQYNANVNSLRAKLAQLEQQALAEKAELAAAQAAARRGRRRSSATDTGLVNEGNVWETPSGIRLHSRDEFIAPGTAAFSIGGSARNRRASNASPYTTAIKYGNRTIADDRYWLPNMATIGGKKI